MVFSFSCSILQSAQQRVSLMLSPYHYYLRVIVFILCRCHCPVEKDSMHAAELANLRSTLAENRATIAQLRAQVSQLQGQLDGQCEALGAAQRLSEQLERKEQAMNALRDEGN